MDIYTKTGDKGETDLLGGIRVAKYHVAIEAIGDVDELNALVGQLIACAGDSLSKQRTQLTRVQHHLFDVGAILAATQSDDIPVPDITQEDVVLLERWIDDMQVELPGLQQFILPGGDVVASRAFYLRAVCRRAERRVVQVAEQYSVPNTAVQYLNRLSDALFMFGRYVNMKTGDGDVFWEKE